MTALDALLREIGVVAPKQPTQPRLPVAGWTPSKPGEEPPF